MRTEWSAIESNREIIEIYADGAKFGRVQLFGKKIDDNKGFQQMEMSPIQLWK